MPCLFIRLVPVLSTAVAIVVTPDTALAKCIVEGKLPGWALIVDGALVGEYEGQESPDLPPAAEIARVEVGCRDVAADDGSRLGRQTAIIIYTVDGYATALEQFLRTLVQLQEERFAAYGAYATDLSELSVVGAGAEVPVEISVSGSGWWASTQLPGLPIRCEVYSAPAGTSSASLLGSLNGSPRCRNNES